MSKSSSEKSSSSATAGLVNPQTVEKSEPSLIDPTLSSSNPGTYEDLHKKTKGDHQKKLINKMKYFFNFS